MGGNTCNGYNVYTINIQKYTYIINQYEKAKCTRKQCKGYEKTKSQKEKSKW